MAHSRTRARRTSGHDRPPHVVVATRVYAPEPVAAAFRQEALVVALERAGAEVTVLTTTAPGTSAVRSRAGRVSRWPVKRDDQGQVRGYFSYLSFDIPLALSNRLLSSSTWFRWSCSLTTTTVQTYFGKKLCFISSLFIVEFVVNQVS